MKIYVCSPYGGKQENYERALEHCRAVAAMGHIPLASHVMLHGILNDHVPAQRQNGLAAGLALVEIADEVWVFGQVLSPGMEGEITHALKLGVPVKRNPLQQTKQPLEQGGRR
ncbi:MAG: DUF4406 domain-containing protein [Peptococcaceae bacterium]|nr:DUF4406 domain-containing protein [Peptococcaceae bacterium]